MSIEYLTKLVLPDISHMYGIDPLDRGDPNFQQVVYLVGLGLIK